LFLTWDGVDAHVETIHPSKSITKQPMPAWFVCTTNDGPLAGAFTGVSGAIRPDWSLAR